MKKKVFLTLFFIIGFFSLILQAIFFREFYTAYYGNEFVLSIVYFIYFLSIASGVFIYKNLSNHFKDNFFVFNVLAIALIAFSLLNMHSISAVKFISNSHSQLLQHPSTLTEAKLQPVGKMSNDEIIMTNQPRSLSGSMSK